MFKRRARSTLEPPFFWTCRYAFRKFWNETGFLRTDFELEDVYSDFEDDSDNEDDFEDRLFGGNFDDEEKGDISFKIHESLDMFNRLKKYN